MPKSSRHSPRKDEMGYIDPDHIDEDVYEEHNVTVDESPSKNKSPSAIAIFQDFIHRSASRAVQEHLAGVYACLAGPADRIPEPDNIPPVATAAAATAFERPGDAVARDLQFGYEAGHDEGIGDDKYVVEKSVDEYNEIGIVKSNINYDEDSDFADEKPAFDMSYYREHNVRRGRSLTDGGPERPDTSGMTKASAKYEQEVHQFPALLKSKSEEIS